MALELKEVLTYLGIAEADSIEKFKESFSPSFIRKDLETIRGDAEFFGKLIGAKSQGTITALKRALKKHEIKVEDAALDGKLEEVIENIFDTTATGYKGKIKELEDLAKTGTDEKIAKFTKDLADKETALQTALAKVATTETEYGNFKTETATKAKNDKINAGKEKLYGSFKWSSVAKDNELVQEGFKSHVEKKFNFDLDDKGEFVITDKEGKKINNPAKAGSTFLPEELLISEGIEKKVYAQNPHTPPTPPKVPIKTEENNPPPADLRRKVNTSNRALA